MVSCCAVEKRTNCLMKCTLAYRAVSFKFDVIAYQGTRTKAEQRELMESFDYLKFEGPIRMESPDETFAILEDYDFLEKSHLPIAKKLKKVCFGRLVAESQRDVIEKYNLKKRKYIGTTSFDAGMDVYNVLV